MSISVWKAVIAALEQKNVTFEIGLAPGELAHTERLYGFLFPPDLREFLSLALPVSDDFPNWRTGQIKRGIGTRLITELLDWPARGMCFDVENDGFWMRDWGPKPHDLREAFEVARRMVKLAPPLIPVFSHRFLPAEPSTEGNPVLSVYQTDIVYYGINMASYFANEFKFQPLEQANETDSPRRIRFWSDIIDRTDEVFYASQRGL
jgi:hypothetical protein